MFKEIGEFLGSCIVVLYALTILNFFVKFIFKNFRNQLSRNQTVHKAYIKIMKLIVKYHKLFGFLTILFILAHSFLQYIRYGINIGGVIAAVIMILQILLGIYGSRMKKRSKPWLISHRALAVILLAAIAIHTA